MTHGACRTIASARGFAVGQVNELCQPNNVQKSCLKDGSCRTCMTDLKRLSYRQSQNACHAVTYAPPPEKKGTVVIQSAIVVGRDGPQVTSRSYTVK